MSWKGAHSCGVRAGNRGNGLDNPGDHRREFKPVTFYKDVLPVLQNNCQTCHRPVKSRPCLF